jgi:sec-independent protein translocase protein TatC
MIENIKPHIKELRKRLIISTIALIIIFFICFSIYEPILNFIIKPVKDILPNNINIIALEIQETFLTAFKVSFFSAFLLSLPIILSQIWLFINPALYEHEKRLLIPFVFFTTIMFILGSSFAYYIVIPYAFDFLINFGNNVVFIMPSISKYVSFFTKILFGFGICFQLPVIIFFLAKISLVNDKMLKDFFKYAIIIIFIFASILTPPDIITQLLMATPLIILYIISIYIAKIYNPYKNIK